MSVARRMGQIGVALALAGVTSGIGQAQEKAGDPHRGAQAFRQCAACHSVVPGQHLSGPSLARIWGRKAGTVDGFTRYSDALTKAGVVWAEKTLDKWLEDPAGFVPGTTMTFPGIKDGRERADVVGYLNALGEGRAPALPPGGGMMVARPRVDLKRLGKEHRVRAIRYCGDAYHVTTEAGESRPFWELNLRFKTDSSREGPEKGTPVLIPAGMMGDRSLVVFSAPEEISAMIERRC